MKEISKAFHKLFGKKERMIVITHGKEPVVISTFDYESDSFSLFVESEVPKVDTEEIVDTNGCGDSFVGGFLSQYLKGKEIAKCAEAV